MPEFLGSSDGDGSDPQKAYQRYREENGLETNKEDVKPVKQNKTEEVLLEEYISHRDAYRETFSEEEKYEYFTKLKELRKVWLDSTKSN